LGLKVKVGGPGKGFAPGKGFGPRGGSEGGGPVFGSTGGSTGSTHPRLLWLTSWASKAAGRLLNTTLNVTYSCVSTLDQVVQEVFSSQAFAYALQENAVSVLEALANQTITITMNPPLNTSPLLYILNWTSGIYLFDLPFTIESVNGQFYSLRQLLNGQYELIINNLQTLSGIFRFEERVTRIVWSAIPSQILQETVQQLYFTVGTLDL